MRKGFEPDTEIQWDAKVLKTLCEVLNELAPGGEFEWKNKDAVHFSLPEQKQPWVTIETKKPDALWVHVMGPEGSLSLNQVRGLADSANSEVHGNRDVIRLAISSVDQVANERMSNFLNKHLQTMLAGAS